MFTIVSIIAVLVISAIALLAFTFIKFSNGYIRQKELEIKSSPAR